MRRAAAGDGVVRVAVAAIVVGLVVIVVVATTTRTGVVPVAVVAGLRVGRERLPDQAVIEVKRSRCEERRAGEQHKRHEEREQPPRERKLGTEQVLGALGQA